MAKRVVTRPRNGGKPAGIPVLLLAVAFALALAACGGSLTPPPSGTGFVSVVLTDAPSRAFDNVWITVRDIWFNTNATAPFDELTAGWTRFPLDNAVTVNLADLAGGDLFPVPAWDNLALPAGTYRQILLFLASTEDPLDNAALAEGLSFNNQVDVDSTRRQVPLRVPNAAQGIRIAIPFQLTVTDNATRRLAIDLDIDRDVVPLSRGPRTDFILKPLLGIFDLDDAGAIVGHIDNTSAADNTAFFLVKAEQLDTALGARTARRSAVVDNVTGEFVLYPIAPGPPGYDVVIRGNNYRTVIIRGVPVTSGTTPTSSPADLGAPIVMDKVTAPELDYLMNGTVVMTGTANPLPGWVRFYQTIPPDTIPHEIQFRHADPLSGLFTNVPLSNSFIRVGTFSGRGSDNTIDLTPTTAAEGGALNGFFAVRAEAFGFDPGLFQAISPAFGGQDPAAFNLAAGSPVSDIANTVSGLLTVPNEAAPGLDNVFAFATRGGVLVNAQPLGARLPSTFAYAIVNLPGGTAQTPFPDGTYAVSAFGWSNSLLDNTLWVGVPSKQVANLSTGNDTVNILTLLPSP